LNSLAEDPELWNDPEKAQKIMKERTRIENAVNGVREVEQGTQDQVDLIELGEEEGDEEIVKEAIGELKRLSALMAAKQLDSLLSGEADGNDAFVEINAGAGGTESCDWANMLFRMYLRWAERRGYKTEILDQHDGDEAGIKSVTIEVKGENAYGWLKTENGVHRLVRISPFDSNAKRHTSFVSVAVSPVIDDDIEIELEDKDLRVDTYRASGAGGQHVNKTDSAVRITHIPTGVAAACQNQRSQHQNRDAAMKMLKAKLYELELEKREEAAAEAHNEKTDIGWGHQIRSYVLHPYQMIKDLRTEVETSNTQAVLDGDLDMFLEASLAQKLEQKKSA
jgi:peptide chain release factor 2